MIGPDQEAAYGVVVLMPYLPLDQERHEHRRERDGQKAREEHGERLGKGKGLEQPAGLLLERKDRQEPDGDHEEREEQRRPDLLRRFDDHIDARAGPARLFPVLELLVRVLDHDDRGVHHGADGDGNAAQAHDVRAEPEIIHAEEGDEDSHGQGEDHDEGAREVEEKNNADRAYGKPEFDDLITKCFDGPVDELGAVIHGDDLHAFGQRGRDLLDLFLHALDDSEHVLAKADHDDAADSLSIAVEVGHAAPDLGPELDRRNVPEENGRALAVGSYRYLFDVRFVLNIPAAADHVLPSGPFHNAAFNVPVAPSDRLHDLHKREVIGVQPVRVYRDLVLLHEPAHARDLRDSRHGLDNVLERPV